MNHDHLRLTLQLTVISVLYWIALLGGIALSSRRLPRRWYDHHNFFFRTRAWESRLYDVLHIRAWKDYLPELGGIVGFAKDRLPGEIDEAYIDRFLWETCYTEAAHWFCMFAGFSFILLSFLLEETRRHTGIFVSVSAFNFFAHLPFIFIQRYNRPRLEQLKSLLGRSPA